MRAWYVQAASLVRWHLPFCGTGTPSLHRTHSVPGIMRQGHKAGSLTPAASAAMVISNQLQSYIATKGRELQESCDQIFSE